MLKDRLAKANDAYWTGQVVIQERAAGVGLRLPRAAKGMPLRRCARPPTWKIEVASMLRWKIVFRRSGKCSASCCSKPMSLRQALKEFEASLRNNPNRYRSFAGAAKAAERAGDRAQARSYYEKLIALAAQSDDGRPDVLAAKQYLAGN